MESFTEVFFVGLQFLVLFDKYTYRNQSCVEKGKRKIRLYSRRLSHPRPCLIPNTQGQEPAAPNMHQEGHTWRAVGPLQHIRMLSHQPHGQQCLAQVLILHFSMPPISPREDGADLDSLLGSSFSEERCCRQTLNQAN